MSRSITHHPLRWAAALAAVVCGIALVGCSDNNSDDKLTVVASTNVWGAVAQAVAGDRATVTSLGGASGDPHEYTPPATDIAKISEASVVVLNGGGYDKAVEDAAAKVKSKVVAFDLLDKTGRPGSINEHVFYDLGVVAQVADKIAAALGERSKDNADYFTKNANAFTQQVKGLSDKVTAIRTAHPGSSVVQTEPLAGYLLEAAGISDATPPGFEDSTEAGESPSAADTAATNDLISGRKVRALLYNGQTVTDTTKALLQLAKDANLPVVTLTETIPEGGGDYIAWMGGAIEALGKALDAT